VASQLAISHPVTRTQLMRRGATQGVPPPDHGAVSRRIRRLRHGPCEPEVPNRPGVGFESKIDNGPGEAPEAEMASMKRGVGYCENTDCEDYAKGVFLLNHGDTFYCPRCRQLGKVEKERGFYTGNTDIFKEVRVEYNFDPINSVYREIAIVRDESLWGRNNVYTLQSPLIKTEKRALKVAEAILANLNRYRGLLNGDDIPRTTEIILSFDEPFEEFSRKLEQLSREWEASGLREGQR
jgi:ribosomal protein S27AE